MIMEGSHHDITFHLTLHATSPAFYYALAGRMYISRRNNQRLSPPAYKTSGTISLRRSLSGGASEQSMLTPPPPGASLTWYERLWGAPDLFTKNSTYFNLRQ
ncbi:hypothetical protein BDV23DRAFT_56185 [Aspergillus alliaceus]|uniref:Uncharacterized protein n=1 Tax=Petromyces alliaceus TaxID=209559 RepID=A0A5N7CDK2_PETAA|nr:hypothetical protein BDV23DRAFT_56185 [Aspergillus alliaceus]